MHNLYNSTLVFAGDYKEFLEGLCIINVAPRLMEFTPVFTIFYTM